MNYGIGHESDEFPTNIKGTPTYQAPLSINSYGAELYKPSMHNNTQQTETPTYKNIIPPCFRSQIPDEYIAITRENAPAAFYNRPSEDHALAIEFLEVWDYLQDYSNDGLFALLPAVDATIILLYLESSKREKEWTKQRFLEVGTYLLTLCGNGKAESLDLFQTAIAEHPEPTIKVE